MTTTTYNEKWGALTLGLPVTVTRAELWAQTEAALHLNAYMGPHAATLSGPQVAFLLSWQKEVLYGGATKGGKTDALLMAALQYVHIPYYQALILDRSFTNLTRGDGIIPRFREWTADPKLGVKWDDENHAATFPGGAKLTFGFIEKPGEEGRYKRANYQFIGWEELTEHPPGELPTTPPTYYTYLFSRLARPADPAPADNPIPLRVRATTNPDGVGREWVKVRFGLGHDDTGHPLPKPPPTRHFIPATYKDNPGIDQDQVEESLSETSAETQAQLLDGNWDVTAIGTTFDVDQIRAVALPQAGVQARYRGWDKAGTDAGEARKARRAKYTVGVRLSRVDRALYGVEYIIEDVIRGQWGIDRRNRVIREAAGIYRPDEQERDRLVRVADPWDVPGQTNTHIIIEQEPADAGKESAQITVSQLAGRIVEVFKPSTNKETRAGPFAAQVNAGNVGMVRAPWNETVKNELRAFPRGVYSDIVDAAGMAFNKLALTPAPHLPASSAGTRRVLALPAGLPGRPPEWR